MKPYNVWSSLVVVLTVFTISCSDNSTPTPSGGGGGNTTSLPVVQNQLIGKWRLDSVYAAYPPPTQSGILTQTAGSNISLQSNVASNSPDLNCATNTMISINTTMYFGNILTTQQSTWQIIDVFGGCGGNLMNYPIAYRYLLSNTGGESSSGYIESVNGSSLVLVNSSVPSSLPSFPQGATASRAYFTKIP